MICFIQQNTVPENKVASICKTKAAQKTGSCSVRRNEADQRINCLHQNKTYNR